MITWPIMTTSEDLVSLFKMMLLEGYNIILYYNANKCTSKEKFSH